MRCRSCVQCAMQCIVCRPFSYNRWMIRFDDKVAFITGGTSGIGRAAAERLATLGVKVAIAGRNRQVLGEIVEHVTNSGGEAFAVSCDVSQSSQVEQAV